MNVRQTLFILIVCLLGALGARAQGEYPSANPTMTYIDEEGT